MEIILKKDHIFVTKVVPNGTRVRVTNDAARLLISQGIARPLNFIDSTKEKINAMFVPADKEYAVPDEPEAKPKTTPDYNKQESLTKKGRIKNGKYRSN